MQNELSLPDIITALNAMPDISGIVWSRIYWGSPKLDTQPWIYMTVNTISEIPDITNKVTRVEFRFYWHNDSVTYANLMDLKNKVTNNLLKTFDFNWFSVYKITEGTQYMSTIDEKNRKLLLKDYFFYYLT